MIGQANKVLSLAAQLDDNPSNTPTGDVVIGYLDPNDTSSSPPSTAAASTTFNSVQVNAIRSSSHVGVVPALFSRAMGYTGTTVGKMSTALVELFQIGGFNPNGPASAGILPIVMSQVNYDKMMGGTTEDHYTFTPGNYSYPLAKNAPNGVTNGPDHIPESVIFPLNDFNAGNWGTINFGVSNNSTKTLGEQISNGVTPAQMQNEYGGRMSSCRTRSAEIPASARGSRTIWRASSASRSPCRSTTRPGAMETTRRTTWSRSRASGSWRSA